MNIDLNIKTLVLPNLPAAADRDQITAAVEQALSQLLSERGVPSSLQQGGAIPYIDAGRFDFSAEAGPESWGHQIAESIYRGWGGE